MTSLFRKYLYRKESEPYKHDEDRGEWASNLDFYLASIGFGLGFKQLTVHPTFLHEHGASLFITCIIHTFWTTVPILFIQSVLGQFSNSGVLSVFRISPLFKGIGYAVLIFNISSVTYLSVMATYPLFYFIKSFSSQLPWVTCGNSWNTENCSTFYALPRNASTANFLSTSAPMEYYQLNVLKEKNDNTYEVSWEIVGCNLLLWICVFGCLVNGIKSVGRATRVTIIIAFGLLILIFLRVICLPGSMDGIQKRITAEKMYPHFGFGSWFFPPAINLLFLRIGWGTPLTIASYNSFKANTFKYSLIIPLIFSIMMLVGSLLTNSVFGFLENQNILVQTFMNLEMEIPFVFIAYGFAKMETPQFWSILFFLMLFLLELISIVLQVFTLLTAVFDEYIWIRTHKKLASLITCGALFLGSIMYTTVNGIRSTDAFSFAAGGNQLLIYFFEFMIVLWVYGRERLQRDIHFMLNRILPTWQIFFIRFTTPLLLLMMSFPLWYAAIMYSTVDTTSNVALLVFMKMLPMLLIPGYIIYKLCTLSGSFLERLINSVKPTEWYPAEPSMRIQYDAVKLSSDMSHQLLDVNGSEK